MIRQGPIVCAHCRQPAVTGDFFCTRCGWSLRLGFAHEEATVSTGAPAALPRGYHRARKVGRHAHGTRWLASDEVSDTLVALLEFPSDERALDELRRSSELSNSRVLPHIIPWRAVATGDGRMFAVMPWVEGASLRELLEQEGCFEVPEALWILTQLCAAISAADAVNLACESVDTGRVIVDASGMPLLSEFGAGDTNNSAGANVAAPMLRPREGASLVARAAIAQYELGVITLELLLGRDVAARARTIISESAGSHSTSMDAFFSRAGTRFPSALVELLSGMLSERSDERWPSLAVVVRQAEGVDGFDAVAARSRLAARVARVRLRRELAEQLASYGASVASPPVVAAPPASSIVQPASSSDAAQAPPTSGGDRRVRVRRIAIPVLVGGGLLSAALFAWRNLPRISGSSLPTAAPVSDSLNTAVRTPSNDVPTVAMKDSSETTDTAGRRSAPTPTIPQRAPGMSSVSTPEQAVATGRPIPPNGPVAKPLSTPSSTDSTLLVAKPVAATPPITPGKPEVSRDTGVSGPDPIKQPNAGEGAAKADDSAEQARNAVAGLLNGPSSALPTAIETARGQDFLAMLKQDKWPSPISVQSVQGSATEIIALYSINGLNSDKRQWSARLAITSSSRTGKWLKLVSWQRVDNAPRR